MKLEWKWQYAVVGKTTKHIDLNSGTATVVIMHLSLIEKKLVIKNISQGVWLKRNLQMTFLYV